MFRELDQRTSDRMTVTLEWDPATGEVRLRCQGDRVPAETLCYSVDPGEAALAFKHPFAMRPASIDRVRLDESRDRLPRGGQGRWRRWLRARGGRTNRTSGDYSWPWWLI
jgi:hypothetical protein